MSDWTRQEVFGRVLPAEPATQRPKIIAGLLGKLACGCEWVSGVRMDNAEAAFISQACPLHQLVHERVRTRWFELPPNDTPLGDLFEQLFAEEVARAT